jgi:hypothetical protein
VDSRRFVSDKEGERGQGRRAPSARSWGIHFHSARADGRIGLHGCCHRHHAFLEHSRSSGGNDTGLRFGNGKAPIGSARQEVVTAMTAVPTVSVCMPVSRDSRLVGRALRSVLSQDLDDFEVLIGDETGLAEPAVVEVDDPRVHFRRNPHRLGFAQNHVTLLDGAVGRYLL